MLLYFQLMVSPEKSNFGWPMPKDPASFRWQFMDKHCFGKLNKSISTRNKFHVLDIISPTKANRLSNRIVADVQPYMSYMYECIKSSAKVTAAWINRQIGFM